MARIVGHHKRLDLAIRHLRALQREYPDAKIISRRNEKGRYSSRGNTFMFQYSEEIEIPPEEFEEIELVGGFDSPGRKRK